MLVVAEPSPIRTLAMFADCFVVFLKPGIEVSKDSRFEHLVYDLRENDFLNILFQVVRAQ